MKELHYGEIDSKKYSNQAGPKHPGLHPSKRGWEKNVCSKPHFHAGFVLNNSTPNKHVAWLPHQPLVNGNEQDARGARLGDDQTPYLYILSHGESLEGLTGRCVDAFHVVKAGTIRFRRRDCCDWPKLTHPVFGLNRPSQLKKILSSVDTTILRDLVLRVTSK